MTWKVENVMVCAERNEVNRKELETLKAVEGLDLSRMTLKQTHVETGVTMYCLIKYIGREKIKRTSVNFSDLEIEIIKRHNGANVQDLARVLLKEAGTTRQYATIVNKAKSLGVRVRSI